MSKCIVCGGKADLLCDSWLGWERKRGEMERDAPNLLTCQSWGVPIRYRAIHTCDAPLCRACAVPAGGLFARFRGGGMVMDTIDYCPGQGRGNRRLEITGLQAEAMRKAWRAPFLARREGSAAEQLALFGAVTPITNAGTAGESPAP